MAACAYEFGRVGQSVKRYSPDFDRNLSGEN